MKKHYIAAAIVFSLVVVYVGTVISAIAYGERYHVMEIQDRANIYYVLDACYFFDHDCHAIGNRFDHTPEGLAKAEDELDYFLRPRREVILHRVD